MSAELWAERLFWAALLILSNAFTYWALRKASGTALVDAMMDRVLKHDGTVISDLVTFLQQAKEERQSAVNTLTCMADTALRHSAGDNNRGVPLPPFDRGIPKQPEDEEEPAEPLVGSDKLVE